MISPTNLSIPPLPDGSLLREQLLEKLQQGRHKKLTLVTAPAGYGKTTLLSAWATLLKSKGWQVYWFSLQADSGENGRFLNTLSHLLQPHAPFPLDAYMQSKTGTHQQLQQLIQQLHELSQPTILILDDYHHLNNTAINQAIQTLLAKQPHQFHLALGSRQQPKIQLARWRANQQLTELKTQDLAFSAAETAALFQQPTTPIIQEITERTEGWAAGLQLARLMLNDQQQDYAHLLAHLQGSQRTIFDYLSEEIFQRQPQATQQFLLQTSLLTQFTADLCQAVVTESDSQEQIAYLMRHNLFITQIDASGEWFRYHQLFAQFLQHRLQKERACSLPDLHQRASNWHRQNGLAKMAVYHALATGKQPFARNVIAEQASNLLQIGDTVGLIQAVQTISSNWIAQQPSLALIYALALMLQGQAVHAQQVMQKAMPHLQSKQLGSAYVIQTALAQRMGNMEKMLATAEKAHRHLDPNPTPLTQFLGVNLAELYAFRLGKSKAALELLTPLQRQLQQEATQPYLYFHTTNLYAATLAMQGQLQTAHALYQHAVSLGKRWQTPYLLGAIQAGLGKIYLEWGDFSAAEPHFRAGLLACQQMKQIVPLISNAVSLARLYWRQGKQTQAQAIITEARQDALANPAQLARLTNWQTWRKADNGWVGLAVATQSASQKQLSSPPSYPLLFAQLRAIQLEVTKLRDTGRLATSPTTIRQLLQQLYTLAQQAGQIETCLDVGLTQVIFEARLGQTAVAQTHLQHVLTLAKPYGYLNSFLDLDPLPGRLLQQSYHQQNLPTFLHTYAERILASNTADSLDRCHPIEPLTPREQEVLTLLGHGFTNQAIADQLHLTVGTVRWHARNIYSKLDANNRTHAVARARAIGYLS